MNAAEALERLKTGNKAYIGAKYNTGDISEEKRRYTALHGQHPYAAVITCSDSRVIPESIFSAGIGELFVIRVAGNVIDRHQLGSIEYAASHLGCRLAVVLGHTHCGAVEAAMSREPSHEPSGYVKYITDEIQAAIANEKDTYKACCLNVKRSVSIIKDSLNIKDTGENGMIAVGAVYDTESGTVEFLTD